MSCFNPLESYVMKPFKPSYKLLFAIVIGLFIAELLFHFFSGMLNPFTNNVL